jgi:hypothetical protein
MLGYGNFCGASPTKMETEATRVFPIIFQYKPSMITLPQISTS